MSILTSSLYLSHVQPSQKKVCHLISKQKSRCVLLFAGIALKPLGIINTDLSGLSPDAPNWAAVHPHKQWSRTTSGPSEVSSLIKPLSITSVPSSLRFSLPGLLWTSLLSYYCLCHVLSSNVNCLSSLQNSEFILSQSLCPALSPCPDDFPKIISCLTSLLFRCHLKVPPAALAKSFIHKHEPLSWLQN